MKKIFRLDELDCANCAVKMEDAIQKIDGVKNISVNFIMQKMTVEAEDDVFEDIMKQIIKVCKKIEPDCKIIMWGALWIKNKKEI